MAFTTESLQSVNINQPEGHGQLPKDLPVREFIGYDPNNVKKKAPVESTAQGTPPTEPAEAPIPKVPEDTQEVQLSPKLSAVARKDMLQRQKEKDLFFREKQLEEKLKKAEQFEAIRDRIAKGDYSAAKELGIEYEGYVKHELNEESLKDPATERVVKLEEELARMRKDQEERDVQEYQANQALWKEEIAKVVRDNDEFVTIKELKAEDAILQHINDSFEEDNVRLSVEEAARDIAKAIDERANKFLSLSKYKKSDNQVAEKKVLGAPPTETKTITQNMTTTPKTSTASKPFYAMSESEQWAEAKRRYEAKLLQR